MLVSTAQGTPRTLPTEVWQDIIELVCNHGATLWDSEVRQAMLSLQRTCKLFYEICTPILQQNVYITSGYQGYQKYRAYTQSKAFGKQILDVFAILRPESIEKRKSGAQPRGDVETLEVKRCLLLMLEWAYAYEFRVGHTHLVDYAGYLEPRLEFHPSCFASLRRMTILGGFVTRICSFAQKVPMLEELLLIVPDAKTSILDAEDDPSLGLQGKLRVTCIFPRAKTINDRNFNAIQHRQGFIQDMRHSKMTFYLANTAEESDSYGLEAQIVNRCPFRIFITKVILDGSIYDWCRENARLCGQQTGLTVMPF